MISSSQSKLIRSLSQKKFRDQHQLYLMEGEKMVGELIRGEANMNHRIHQLFATGDWIDRNGPQFRRSGITPIEATPSELKKVSNLVTPQQVLALIAIPDHILNTEALQNNTVLAFDAIRDPGNLGTIIRTADWFGINHVICSPDSTDVFNPKVVQSTMGAIMRVRVNYLDIAQLLAMPFMENKMVYGTFLEGFNIYNVTMEPNPLILFGNESHGLSDRFDPYIKLRIAIPSFSQTGKGSESLNVASSVAVVCSEIRRG